MFLHQGRKTLLKHIFWGAGGLEHISRLFSKIPYSKYYFILFLLNILIIRVLRLILCTSKYEHILCVMSLRKMFTKRKKSVSFRTRICSVGWGKLEVVRLSSKHSGTRKHQCLCSANEVRLPEDRPRTDTWVCMYKLCLKSIQPCIVKDRDLLKKI